MKFAESEQRQCQLSTAADKKRRQVTSETRVVTQVIAVKNSTDSLEATLTTVENNDADTGAVQKPPPQLPKHW